MLELVLSIFNLTRMLPECRSGKRAIEADVFKRNVEVEENLYSRDTAEAFAMADVDGSGNVTLSQYLAYMNVDGQSEVHSNWFKL